MSISLCPLPYARHALEPWISASALNCHYDQHYAGYVNALEELLAEGSMADESLPELVCKAWKSGDLAMFNNAAQAWNHEFYYESLHPMGSKPTWLVNQLISRDFGTLENLLHKLTTTSIQHFGSGWVWLVLEAEHLKVVATANADTPLIYGRQVPLLAIDVWEHAYYLDYQNDRRRYTELLVGQILDWNRVHERLVSHKAGLLTQNGSVVAGRPMNQSAS